MLQFRFTLFDSNLILPGTSWVAIKDCGCHSTIKQHAEYLLEVNQRRNPSKYILLEYRDTEEIDWPEDIDV